MMPQYCLSKRGIVMTVGGLTLSTLLVLIIYQFFGRVVDSSALKRSVLIESDQFSKLQNNNNNGNRELQLIHVVFRHGPRTPADTYPNDPYINEAFYPFGWGQLTNEGKEFLYDTGKWLRKRYNNFLGTFYQPDILHAQATGVSRTHMSLALVLASLFPPKNTPTEWNKDLNWQPIPIYSEQLDKDTLLLVRTTCPRYYEALAEVFGESQVEMILKAHYPIFKELTKITGLNISDPDDAQSLYSTLRAEEEFGLKLPSWTKSYYPDKLKYITELSYIFNVYNDELKRIKGGPFIKKMLDEWEHKRENTLEPKTRKMYIYAGHDSTVVNILSALNIWERQIPVYGIMGIFELYKDLERNEYNVQIYLKNETHREPYPLVIPGCDINCPLDKIKQLTSSIIPQDISVECKSSDPNFTEPPLSGP